MRYTLIAATTSLAAQSALALPARGLNERGVSADEARKRANEVQDVFQTAWDGYYKYVWLKVSEDRCKERQAD